jgi:hypothetical protein
LFGFGKRALQGDFGRDIKPVRLAVKDGIDLRVIE